MACCFSGFKQLFAEGQEFSYGQENVGRYYKAYVDIMSHWETALPGRVLKGTKNTQVLRVAFRVCLRELS